MNWNSWQDTARCVSACAKLENFAGAVFVIDNGSTDDSYDRLKEWLEHGLIVNPTGPSDEIRFLEMPPEINFFKTVIGDSPYIEKHIKAVGVKSRGLYLVRSDVNNGFGAGNNIGIRLGLLDESVNLFWCLNADAVPLPKALFEIEKHCLGRSEPILAGSVLLEYSLSKTIQTVGSNFSRLTLKVGYRHEGEPIEILDELPSAVLVDYPIGAALVMNRVFIAQHGMFDERYFLYFEEPDLAVRLRGSRPFICTHSFVYHKGGQTTGAGTGLQSRGGFADYHYNRSRALLAVKLGAGSLFMAILASAYSVIRRLKSRRPDLAKHVFPAFWDGLKAYF